MARGIQCQSRGGGQNEAPQDVEDTWLRMDMATRLFLPIRSRCSMGREHSIYSLLHSLSGCGLHSLALVLSPMQCCDGDDFITFCAAAVINM